MHHFEEVLCSCLIPAFLDKGRVPSDAQLSSDPLIPGGSFFLNNIYEVFTVLHIECDMTITVYGHISHPKSEYAGSAVNRSHMRK